MTKAKELPDSSLKTEWCDFILEDHKKLVIPVGPRFQADVPVWANSQNEGTPVAAEDIALRVSIPSNKEMVLKYKEEESGTSKWFGTLVWPTEDNLENKEVNKELIGKGRNEHCLCKSPGSVECVRRHVKEEITKLKSELKTTFNVWKFDEMGEEVYKLWNTKEQTQFIVKTSLSKGKSFLKPALAWLPLKNRKSIINYYFNVHIPQRIRSSCKTINTDDEEEEEEEEKVTTPKRSRKRNLAKSGASSSCNSMKTKYLSGRRWHRKYQYPFFFG